jgi:hypothetical protein
MLSQYIFNETSPSAASTNAASSQQVIGSQSSTLGIASGQLLEDCTGINVVAELVGATGGTLDVFLQAGFPDGSWIDVVHFAQLASAAAAITYSTQLSNLPQPASAAPVAVGTGLHSGATGLAAGTTVQGLNSSMFRLLMCSGVGTSAGAAVKVYVTAQRTYGRAAG